MTPLDQIAECLHDSGDQTAFCIGEKNYSYDELRRSAGKIQAAIASTNIHSHCNIGIITYDDIETYASVLAVMFLGHTFVPIHPGHPKERNASIIRQAEIKILLCSKEFSSWRSSGVEHILDTSAGGDEKTFIQVPMLPAQHAYILFTSGSTGLPKGVPITIGNLNSFLDAFFSMGFSLDNRDRFIQMFDLTFDLSIMSYLVPLCIGASVYTVPHDVIKSTHVYTLLEKHDITFALLVPSILTGIRKYFQEISLPHLKYSLFCGEALHTDMAQEWDGCLPAGLICNTYGPTEATIFCTHYIYTGDDLKSSNGIVSIGKPMKYTEAIIADENLQPVQPGVKGELCLSGEQVTSGYYRNEALNKEAFFNYKGSRYYRTGDLCFMDDTGDLFFNGRLDFQVKINGYRVELSEIEYHARIFLRGHEVVVLANEKEGSIQLLLFAENFTGDFNPLQDYLKEKLPAYMLPSKYYHVKAFPLNTNGKIDRNSLEKMTV